MTSKKTVGQAALEAQKGDLSTDYIEMEREIHKGSKSKKSYEEEIWETVDAGRKFLPGDFYVVVLLKKERLLHSVIRQYFFHRQSCPTPEYDQTVYKYHKDGDKLEYLWTVPDKPACKLLIDEQNNLPLEQQPLVSMVKDFLSGKLDTKAMILNKELVN